MIIKWLVSKILPHLWVNEGVINTCKRLDRLERDSHPPLFDKSQLNKIHKRLEALEMKAFVDKISKYDWQGSD